MSGANKNRPRLSNDRLRHGYKGKPPPISDQERAQIDMRFKQKEAKRNAGAATSSQLIRTSPLTASTCIPPAKGGGYSVSGQDFDAKVFRNTAHLKLDWGEGPPAKFDKLVNGEPKEGGRREEVLGAGASRNGDASLKAREKRAHLYKVSVTAAHDLELSPVKIIGGTRVRYATPTKKKHIASPVNQEIIERLSRPRKRPEPGQHTIQPASASGQWARPGGGRFSTAQPKSDIDIKMLRAAETPGPNEYKLIGFGGAKKGVKISSANPKTDVDWAILRARETPGPNQYKPDTDLTQRLRGGKFSTAAPKTELDWVIHNSPQSPGPNAYDISLCPAQKIIRPLAAARKVA